MNPVRNRSISGKLYQPSISLTYPVMTGHLLQHVRQKMTGSVAGHDKLGSRVDRFADWYWTVFQAVKQGLIRKVSITNFTWRRMRRRQFRSQTAIKWPEK